MSKHTDDRPATSARRDRYHHGDLRRDLLRVAREEIAANGAEGMSLASLARVAGVTQSAPYRHFADRRALLEAVAAEGFEALTVAMRTAVSDRASTLSARDALANAYVLFGEADIELYRLMFASRLTSEAGNGSALNDAAEDAFAFLRSTMATADPAVGAEGDGHRVYRAWAQLHGLVMLKADGFITSPLQSLLAA